MNLPNFRNPLTQWVCLALLALGCSFRVADLPVEVEPEPLPLAELGVATPLLTDPSEAVLELAVLAFDFQRIVTAADMRGRTAELIVTNQFDRDITAVDLTLHYLDDTGAEIGTFPWSISADPTWLDARETRMITAGYRVPEVAVRVEVTVEEIHFFDGTHYRP